MKGTKGIVYDPFYEDLLNNKNTVLFDRIINVQLTKIKSKNGTPENNIDIDYVTIRSDYEVSDTNGGRFFVRCKRKPEIEVSFKSYQSGVIPKMLVRITNFEVFDGDDTKINLSAKEKPFKQIRLQLGYINQFANWEKVSFTAASYKQFVQLEGAKSTVTEIIGNILNVRRIGNPPDSITEIEVIPAQGECSVPSFNTGFLPSADKLTSLTMVNDLFNALQTYKDIYTKDKWKLSDFLTKGNKPTFTECLFYWLISRRYWRNWTCAFKNKAETASRFSVVTTSSDAASLRNSIEANPSLADNIMFLPDKGEDLQLIAVGLRSLKYEIPDSIAAALNDEVSDETLKTMLANYALIWNSSVEQTLLQIKEELFPNLSWSYGYTPQTKASKTISTTSFVASSTKNVTNNCIYLYNKNVIEDEASIKGMLATGNPLPLTVDEMKLSSVSIPALYDITYGAVIEANIPFVGLFPLMYPLRVNSSHILTNFVSYFLSVPKDYIYLNCYSMEIEFSTIDAKGNNCVLKMTEAKDLYL